MKLDSVILKVHKVSSRSGGQDKRLTPLPIGVTQYLMVPELLIKTKEYFNESGLANLICKKSYTNTWSAPNKNLENTLIILNTAKCRLSTTKNPLLDHTHSRSSFRNRRADTMCCLLVDCIYQAFPAANQQLLLVPCQLKLLLVWAWLMERTRFDLLLQRRSGIFKKTTLFTGNSLARGFDK